MKTLVLGASGIIGQHMRLCVPPGVLPIFSRRRGDPLHESCDLTDNAGRTALLERWRPQVVVNLAGENNTDAAERDPAGTREINSEAPRRLAAWCGASGAHYLHVSTQAVFSGTAPPYTPHSLCQPVNEYGRQKLEAEESVRHSGAAWTIVRPTFVLGIRPLPHEGRRNPVEAMLAGAQPRQVSDRWFSPLFARDAAELLWEAALRRPASQTVHLGNPVRMNRCELARTLGVEAEPCAHDSFAGLAPRPLDTAYAPGSRWRRTIEAGIAQCRRDWEARTALEVSERARELALFLGRREDACLARLSRGFHAAHAEVAADFRAAGPPDDAALLDWYRGTESYLWELSAYHADPGFNYSGMCRGIAERLTVAGARRVLCLGDGIGDLTLALRAAGLDAVYHDLAGSRTGAFARFRFRMRLGCAAVPCRETANWDPAPLAADNAFDAAVALDFLEHLTDVSAWCRAIRDALVPGGLFMAQNAFAIGSGPEGSIPCHLARNDRYEREWAPLMRSLGMRQESGNWWRKP